MQCEDAEVLLSEMPEAPSGELNEHLAGCRSCRQTATVLGLASLPEPTALERAALSQLPLRAHQAWHVKEARRFSVQRVAGYALAAGLGALVASASFLSFRAPDPVLPQQVKAVEQRPAETLGEDPDWDVGDEGLAAPADDETAFFDVSWPSLTEGEEQ